MLTKPSSLAPSDLELILGLAAPSPSLSHSEITSTSPDSPNSTPTSEPFQHRFNLPDGNVTFLVKGALYRVHRYFFQQYSKEFAGTYGLHDGPELVIHLEDVERQDFDQFLSIFYPSTWVSPHPDTKTVEEWTSVLRLATKWTFTSIRELAVERLFDITSPVEKVLLAHLFDLPDWLPIGYKELCRREDPLSKSEGRELFKLGETGCDIVVLLNQARQEWRPRQTSSARNIEDVVERVFQLGHAEPEQLGRDVEGWLQFNGCPATFIDEDTGNNLNESPATFDFLADNVPEGKKKGKIGKGRL